jgi:blocked-early-in-transport protein 1
MSNSSRTRVEDVYEAQNDQRLDDLHAKIRTLRGVRARAPRGRPTR